MKTCIRKIAGALIVAALAFTGCSSDSGSDNSSLLMAAASLAPAGSKSESKTETLTQEQMVSKLDEASKENIFESVLAGKNAETILAKLTDTQKSAIFDKMLTDEKKNAIFGELLTDEKKTEIYNEKLTETEKAKIFNSILTDKRTAGTFLALLNDSEKQAVYNELLTDEKKNEIYKEKLTDTEKAKIFDEIFADKRTNGKVTELLNETEKSSIFDALLSTKTSKDFIIEILTRTGNENLYIEVKSYITGKLTKEELVALLDAADKTAPGDVTNLAAEAKSNSVLLTWKDGTNTDNDLYGYIVSWKALSQSRSIVALEHDTMLVAKSSKGDMSNSVTVTDLVAGTKYSFTVQAVDLIGNKSAGVTVEATPESAPAGGSQYSPAISETGEYTIYHYKRGLNSGNYLSNYSSYETESKKTVQKDSTIETLKRNYEGFSAKGMIQNENVIYIFYDRNTIKYIFNAGSEGKFADGATSKEVVGLYGASLTKPEVQSDSDYYFVDWQDAEKKSTPLVFCSENKTYTAVWKEKRTTPEGFVTVSGVSIEGIESWSPSSNIFKRERKLAIPALLACDHEVTRGEFKEIMGTDPSKTNIYWETTDDGRLNSPVGNIIWNYAIAYCNKLSLKENLTPCYSVEGVEDWAALEFSSIPVASNSDRLTSVKWENATCDWTANGYRLPTEAEWEWLARGGENYKFAGSDNALDVGWFSSNSSSRIRKIKLKKANGYGLYDMSGNVSEWCWDTYSSSSITSSTPSTGYTHTATINTSSKQRCQRGEDYKSSHNTSDNSLARREYDFSTNQYDHYGFRVVRKAN